MHSHALPETDKQSSAVQTRERLMSLIGAVDLHGPGPYTQKLPQLPQLDTHYFEYLDNFLKKAFKKKVWMIFFCKKGFHFVAVDFLERRRKKGNQLFKLNATPIS